MSVFAGPEIDNSGLILSIDAANPKSYPGTGTTVYDVSGSNNNFSLQDSSAYILTDKVFRFTLGGTNWISRSEKLNNIANGAVTAYTMFISVKVANTSTSRLLSFDNLNGDTTNRLNFYVNTVNFSGEKNNILSWSSGLNNMTLTNNWIFYATTIDNLNVTSYRCSSANKIEKGTVQVIASSPEIDNSVLIARRGVDTNFGGDIGSVMMYNRVLSESGIRKIFNALRGRHNI